LTAGPHRAR